MDPAISLMRLINQESAKRLAFKTNDRHKFAAVVPAPLGGHRAQAPSIRWLRATENR